MLISIGRVLGAPVMSLQTGQPLCYLSSPIINPYNLRIVAFYVDGPRLDFEPAVVFTEDVREFGSAGVIVDSVDNIMSLDGLVRLQEVINYNFTLDKILVVDDQGEKLGRVIDYIIDPLNFEIQQLHVRPGFLKSFSITSLTIGRQQIVKVEPDRITVKSPTIKAKAKGQVMMDEARRVLNPEFDNPFRKQRPVMNVDQK